MRVSKSIMLLSVIILVSSNCLTAQNLVPNGGFEEYIKCPDSWVNLTQKPVVHNWYSPDRGTPDYYNSCGTGVAKVPHIWAGTQETFEGDGLIGIYNWSKSGYKEYIAVQLEVPLIKDTTYYVHFYFAIAKNAEFACFDIGLALSTDSLINSNTILVIDSRIDSNTWNPDTGWSSIHAIYKSNGTEQYLFIGNFHSKSAPDTIKFINNYVHPMIKGKSYMYIDDVVIEYLFNPIYPVGKPFSIENIYFEFDKSVLKQSSFEELNGLWRYLRNHQNIQLIVFGYTDNVGDEDYNINLSKERAKAVKTHLVNLGIKNTRILTVGKGESNQVESSEVGRSQNRKVEFILNSTN